MSRALILLLALASATVAEAPAPAPAAAAVAAAPVAPLAPAAAMLWHSPHDVIDGFAISPDFDHDKTLFLSLPRFGLLLRSRDAGQSFEPVGGGLDNRSVAWLAISTDYAHDHTLWCAELHGMFVSHDRGDFWLRLPTPEGLRTADALAVSPDFANDGTLAAGTRHDGLWISHDRGATWTTVTLPGKAAPGKMAPVAPLAFSPTYAQDHELLAVLAGDSLVRSSDGGETFTQLKGPGEVIQTLVLDEAFGSSGRLWVGTPGSGVWRSDDKGKSWQPEGSATERMNVLHLSRARDKDGGVLFASTAVDGVVFKKDAGDWTSNNVGFRGQTHQTELHNLGTMPSPAFARDHLVFATSFEGLHVSRKGGEGWEWISVLHPQIVRNLALSSHFAQDQTLWLSSYGSGLLTSTDAGQTFRQLDTLKWAFPDAIAVSPTFAADHTLLVGIPNVLLISQDSGRSAHSALPDSKGFPRYAQFAPDYAQSGIAFAFFNPEELDKNRFVRTATRGITWTDTSLQIGTDMAFASDWRKSGRAFVASSAGLFRSDDRGQTFTRVDSLDFQGVSSVSLAAGAKADTLMATSFAAGVHMSSDGGETWTLLTIGVPPVRPSKVCLSPDFAHDGTAFAGPANDTLFVTRNAGRTWSRVRNGPRVVMSMEVSPTFAADHTLVVGSYEGPWLSSDAGATWRALPVPVPAQQPTSKEASPPPATLPGATPEGAAPEGTKPPDAGSTATPDGGAAPGKPAKPPGGNAPPRKP